MVTRRTERAQVLLIAAVVLALTILMLAVLLNTAVLTEVRSPDDPSTDVVEAERLGTDVEAGATELVAYMNAMNHMDNEIDDVFERTFETYGDVLFESVGERRATHINVSPVAIEQEGMYVADTNRSTNLTVDDDPSIETRVDSSADASILGLELHLNVGSLGDNSTDFSNRSRVELSKDSDCEWLSFTRDGGDLIAYQDDCGATVDPVIHECESVGDYATVSITRHPPEKASACHLNLFDDLGPDGAGFGLDFINPANALGAYHFAVNDTDAVDAGPYDIPGGGTPYATRIAWEATIDTDQWARASQRSTEIRLTPYEDYEYFDLFPSPWGDDS